MIRKAIIVVLTLASIAALCFWADSYHYREKRWNSNPRARFDSCSGFGFETKLIRWDSNLILVSTCKGVLTVVHQEYLDDGATSRNREMKFGGVHCRQWSYHQSTGFKTAEGDLIAKQYLRHRKIRLRFLTIVVMSGLYPPIAFIRGPWRRWRRHRKGLCLKCGYNLEGNVSGVCSECGEAT